MFKEGDWCFSDFKLKVIRRIENNEILEVFDGYGSLSGILTERCFPLDVEIKRISDEFCMYYNKIHKLNDNSLNYPDIVRYLEERWVDTCNNKEDKEYVEITYKEIEEFYSRIKEFINKNKEISLQGVKIFNRRE